MAFSFANQLSIDPIFDDPKYQILGVSSQAIFSFLQGLYNSSKTLKDRMDNYTGILTIDYRKDSAYYETSSGHIFIDPEYVKDWRIIGKTGLNLDYSFYPVLTHELAHKIVGTLDTILPSDFLGENSRFVNGVYADLGIKQFASYWGTSEDDEVTDNYRDYTTELSIGDVVDIAIVEKGFQFFFNGKKFDTQYIDMSTYPVSRDLLIGSLLSNVFYGASGNDYLYGDGKAIRKTGDGDKLFGGAGNDYLRGGGGDDVLRGGEGNDILIGWSGKDFLSGGDIGLSKVSDGVETAKFEGTDAITVSVGGTPLDTTYSSEADFASAYFVQAGTGDIDTLISIEKLVGSSKNDTVKIAALDAAMLADAATKQGGLLEVNLAGDVPGGARGGDRLDLSGMAEGVNLVMKNQSALIAAKADVKRSVTVLDAEHVIGTGHADTMTFQPTVTRNLIVEGGAGDDQITGGAGSDLITGGTGNDKLYGGAGSDRLVADAGHDQLYGGAGNDIIELKTAVATIGFGAGDGSDVVEFDLASGTYTLNMVGLNPGDVEVIGGGFDAYYAYNGDPTANPDGTWYQFLTIRVRSTGDQITFLENGLDGSYNIGPSSDPLPVAYNKGFYPNWHGPSNQGQLDKITFANGTVWNQSSIWNNMTVFDKWAYAQPDGVHGYGHGDHTEADFLSYVKQTYLQAYTDFVV